MPWLAELVEASEGSLDVLPVQCLCEFLLHETQEQPAPRADDESAKFDKHKKKQVWYLTVINIVQICCL